MEPFKIAIKLFADGSLPPLHSFIPVFHQWIREQNAVGAQGDSEGDSERDSGGGGEVGGGEGPLPHHLLIDVADYAHVQDGPGVVLVASEANLHIDENGGKPGLLYVRKMPSPGTFADRLGTAVAATLRAAEWLEKEPALGEDVHFDRDRLVIRLNDRLLTPNNAATFDATRSAFEALAARLYPGQPASIKSIALPRDVFTVEMAVSPPQRG